MAIGGGGFTHESHPELDRFCLEQTPRSAPRIGFVGAADNDEPTKIERFYKRFKHCSTDLDHLPMETSGDGVARWLSNRDLVYFGGGNTVEMVAHFERQGWSIPLKQAACNGVTMAGVSAGAVFWFDWCLSDSTGNGLEPLRGLGLLTGGICPHYSSQPERQSVLHKAVASGAIPFSYAIDDGAAVAFGTQTIIGLCTAESTAGCYQISANFSPGIYTGFATTSQQVPLRCNERHYGSKCVALGLL